MGRGTRVDKIQDVLRTLRTASPEVIGSAVVGMDGFVIGSVLPGEIDDDVVSGMAAAMCNTAKRVSAELMDAPMDHSCVRSERGYVLINMLGSEAALVVLTTRDVTLGVVLLEIKRRLAELMALL